MKGELKTPSSEEYSLARKWLVLKYGNLYSNIMVLDRSMERNEVFMLSTKNDIFGIAAFQTVGSDFIINVFEIRQDIERKGFGSYFFGLIEKQILSNEITTIYVDCFPSESKRFWSTMGFIKSDINPYSFGNCMYKRLVNSFI